MKTLIALSLASTIAAAGMAGTTGVANAAIFASSHTAWCAQNYRSYNPATDTFTGYDGLAHRCVAPGETVTFGAVSPYALVPDNSFVPSNSAGVDQFRNPNGQGSGTNYRVFPGDDENGNPEQPPNN